MDHTYIGRMASLDVRFPSPSGAADRLLPWLLQSALEKPWVRPPWLATYCCESKWTGPHAALVLDIRVAQNPSQMQLVRLLL